MGGDPDIEPYVQGLLARAQRRQDELTHRAEELRARAAEVARALVAEDGARRVWLFGSLAWGEPHEGTDVDLLVEGLPDIAAWSRAMSRAEELIDVPVDLIRVEEAPESLRQRVQREGTLLDEAQ